MNHPTLDRSSSAIDSVLAVERELMPASEDMRVRVLNRAQAALASNAHLQRVTAPRASPVRIGLAVAAGVLLSALCAAAFLAGYGIRNKTGAIHSPRNSEPTTDAPQVPAPAAKPIPLAANETQPAPTTEASEPRTKAGQSGIRPVTDIESFTKELRVLQPAREAVARQDFQSALATIAEHQRLYPSGKLAEEREALRVKALLGLGRTAEAQRAGTAFRSRFPRSALLGRIDKMLGKQQ